MPQAMWLEGGMKTMIRYETLFFAPPELLMNGEGAKGGEENRMRSIEFNGRSGWNRSSLLGPDCYDELSSMSLEHRRSQDRLRNIKHEAGFQKSGHA